MSYKDGIPLLASFEDDVDDDDLTFQNVRPSGKCKCSKRTILFSVVLGLAITLIIGLIVGVTVPVVLVQSNAAAHNKVVIEKSQSFAIQNTMSLSSMSLSVSVTTSLSTMQHISPSNTEHLPASASNVYMNSVQSVSVWFTLATNSSAHISRFMLNPTSSISSKAVHFGSTSKMLMSSSIIEETTRQPSLTLGTTHLLGVTSTSYVVEKTRRQLFTSSFFLSPTPTMTSSPLSNENCTMDDFVCFSLLDDRQYRVVTLSNGLRALLVSDPNSNISAAAMDVAAGSFNDPADYEGLAHFCEHMLFIGTHKYPQLNQYSNYVATHGGSDNAFTSTQHTNYHFYIEADYFSTAVDMFAHFFIDPLFSADSVMDEMNAVNAEHQKNLQSDGWKLWQLVKHVSNPGHPLSLFSTGSLETLNKSDTLEQLLSYFNSSYSANTVSFLSYRFSSCRRLTCLLDWSVGRCVSLSVGGMLIVSLCQKNS